jgi:hypothetical protein
MRKTILSGLFLAGLALLFVGCGEYEDYVIYTNSEHEFRAHLPSHSSEVQHRAETIYTSAGEMQIDYYIFYGPDIIYMVGATPHGIETQDDASVWMGLKIASRRITEEGEILNETAFRLNDYPALLVSYRKEQNGEDFWGKVLITDIEGVQYQVHVAGYQKEALETAPANRFLSSFRRIDPGQKSPE